MIGSDVERTPAASPTTIRHQYYQIVLDKLVLALTIAIASIWLNSQFQTSLASHSALFTARTQAVQVLWSSIRQFELEASELLRGSQDDELASALVRLNQRLDDCGIFIGHDKHQALRRLLIAPIYNRAESAEVSLRELSNNCIEALEILEAEVE